MKCPKHQTDMLVIEELNSNTNYYRCEFSSWEYGVHKTHVHTLLIIDYQDKVVSIKVD